LISRRSFIKTSAIAGTALTGGLYAPDVLGFGLAQPPADLYQLSYSLLQQWAAGLINLQVTDKARVNDYGGIWCPADKAVHGRVGDTIYPFFYLAAKTKDSKYIDSSVLLYRWMESHVSQPDGSWLNEPVKGSWKGTTVFAAIALAEALKNHGSLMDAQFKNEVSARLLKAGDFIYKNFTVDYGNINYPVTASYGLSLLGTLFDVPRFKVKGKELAHQALTLITKKNGFLYGEGEPYYQASKKGCFSVDLGYNVEESLPALVLYGLLTNDEEVLGTVTRSLQTHLEFMLPDGGWDNSWGTRNYKWTYWGSRTSDGCQSAYALMANRDARFYKAALKNTELMRQCTKDGLLYGGPHYIAHQVTPCVHHTFSHIKALTTVLEYGNPAAKINADKLTLPRDENYGSKFFADIQTWLIAKGSYRATVTGYDREYKKTKSGHASGGALTMLWHPKTGPLLCAGMNEYQLYEAGNMQPDTDPYSIPLTPRIELKINDAVYMNISDLKAVITVKNEHDQVIVNTRSKLVDKDQQSPALGTINCDVSYIFTNEKVIIKFSYDKNIPADNIKIIFPVIAKANEKMKVISGNEMRINKENSVVKVSANLPILQLSLTNGRVFNYVPGFEAIPFYIAHNDAVIEINVI
jgi:hypothetical protein